MKKEELKNALYQVERKWTHAKEKNKTKWEICLKKLTLPRNGGGRREGDRQGHRKIQLPNGLGCFSREIRSCK